MVGAALSDYLVGSHDDRLAASIQVDIRSIVALFAHRDSYDVYRWGGFRSRTWHSSPLAYGGAPVHGRHCCSAVRSVAVSGSLGESAAGYRPPMTIEKFKNVRDLVAPCVWGLDHANSGELNDERRL